MAFIPNANSLSQFVLSDLGIALSCYWIAASLSIDKLHSKTHTLNQLRTSLIATLKLQQFRALRGRLTKTNNNKSWKLQFNADNFDGILNEWRDICEQFQED